MVFKPLKPSCTGTLKLAYSQPWNFRGFEKNSGVKEVRITTESEMNLVTMTNDLMSDGEFNVSTVAGK